MSLYWFLLLLALKSSFAVNIEAYLGDGQKGQGTDAREELEFKMAIKDSDNVSAERLRRLLQASIDSLQLNNGFKFSKLIDSKYQMDPSFQNFVFKDYYYDTPNLGVLNSNSALRIRYRWNSIQKYRLFQFLPIIKYFYPSRCEFQFKDNYQVLSNSQIKVTETRFEFRNESSPFDKKNNSPQSPWEFSKYEKYFKSGYFKDYKILPIESLAKKLQKLEVKELNLALKVSVVTRRLRSHLNLENPWGTGPNPNQVFILTIDHSNSEKGSFYEIEIEIDRNISTELNKISNIKDSKDPIDQEAVRYSKIALDSLKLDLNSIQKEFSEKLKSIKEITTLDPSYKYKRLMKY